MRCFSQNREHWKQLYQSTDQKAGGSNLSRRAIIGRRCSCRRRKRLRHSRLGGEGPKNNKFYDRCHPQTWVIRTPCLAKKASRPGADDQYGPTNSANESISGRKNIAKVLGVKLLLSPKMYRSRDFLIMLAPILKKGENKKGAENLSSKSSNHQPVIWCVRKTQHWPAFSIEPIPAHSRSKRFYRFHLRPCLKNRESCSK